MPKSLDQPLDLQYSLPVSDKEKDRLNIILPPSNIDDELDFFTTGMAGTGGSSPFIKDEPDDYNFLHNFPNTQSGYNTNNMSIGSPYGQMNANSMTTSDLAMSNGAFNSQYGMGTPNNMSSSFNLGTSGIADDELLDLDLNDTASHTQHGGFQQTGQPGFAAQPHQAQYFSPPATTQHHRQVSQFSSTPDGAPIQSPFVHGNFHYAGLNNLQQTVQSHPSPQVRPKIIGGQQSYGGARPNSRMASAMHRQTSNSRSPMTPRTPAIASLQLGTPPSGSLPSQPITYQHTQKRVSGQWDSNPDSLRSNGNTPISSPNYAQTGPSQISQILQSGKHASLPAKVENHSGLQSQEAKRKRRRESHNLVERRRRDNINEKIHELSHLVPQHRLDDDKVRKALMSNTPLSPSLAPTGMGYSPPAAATSLLAAGGRRATSGSISLGIPPEDKDKAPNKGDILNGSVSWTRDLMWALQRKYQQEDELKELFHSQGRDWPYESLEDDIRMRTELIEATDKNGPASFNYSRGAGSGLVVPGHTDVMGKDRHSSMASHHLGTVSPHSISPIDQQFGGQQQQQQQHNAMDDMSGMNGLNNEQQQFWDHSFKDEGFNEEDEFTTGMELN